MPFCNGDNTEKLNFSIYFGKLAVHLIDFFFFTLIYVHDSYFYNYSKKINWKILYLNICLIKRIYERENVTNT